MTRYAPRSYVGNPSPAPGPPGPGTRIQNTVARAGHGRAVRCPGIQKLHIQVRPPVEHRDKVDALAQTISEMASVSHVRQKEPLTATR
jgi:hypothetical protein